MDTTDAEAIASPTNFPLKFRDAKVELREAKFNEEFLRGFLPRVEWTALVESARDVSRVFANDRLRSLVHLHC